MKKQVLFGLALMLFCFISGGLYIVTSIQSGTKKLGKVVSFHQVEFLRNNLIYHVKAVQADLLLQDSHHAKGFKSAITLIENMEESADICLNCHHSEVTRNKLGALEESVEHYMKQLSRTMTIRANKVRMENAQNMAYASGQKLLENVQSLSTASADKIDERIKSIHAEINLTNNFLIACLVLGPIAIFIITFLFLNRFAGSISSLVAAAQSIEDGNLDYRVTDTLKDEFRIVATAFNRMASSLKEEQRKLKSAQTLYQTLFESAGDAIMISGLEKDSLGVIVSANKAAEELYGYSVDELLMLNITNLIPEGKEQKFRNKIKKVLSGKWSHQRVKRVKKDRTLIQVDQSMGLLYIGEQKFMLTFCRDVTDILHAEEELHRANQMALVGQMAVGLAHEIKNPLAGIKVSLDVLADDLELQQEDQELFVRVVNEINRMERLLKSLLNYARPPQPHFDLVDVNRLLDNSLKHIEVTASSKKSFPIYFESDFAEELPQIEADSAQIQQVLLNVLLNAMDAIVEGGTITSVTRKDGADGIWIEISDTGKGISGASIDKVFNPFFTTKSKGTGLGLPICKRLVEQHGGTITVESFVGSGTSFVITMPLTQKNQE